MFGIKKKQELKYIEVITNDHCNLKCRACSHFANLAKPHIISLKQYESDLKEITKKFLIKQIRIMGGEPLLHPQINNIMQITRHYIKTTEIDLVTNGILLSEQDETFWNTVINCQIKLDISQYPINNEPYEKTYEILRKYGLDYYATKRNYFSGFFNPLGNYDINKTFKNCSITKNILLREGKIYHCSIAPYIRCYNEFFNTNLEIEEGLDIYKNNATEIIKYLSKPIESCKYCTFSKENCTVKINNWELSKQEPDEWYK